MVNKMLLWLSVGLCVALLGCGLYIHTTNTKKALLEAQNESLSNDLRVANRTINDQKEAYKIANNITTKVVEVTSSNIKAKEELVKRVDDVTKQLKSGKVSSSVADNVYISSMWEAYCKADPTGGSCSTGRTSSEVHY